MVHVLVIQKQQPLEIKVATLQKQRQEKAVKCEIRGLVTFGTLRYFGNIYTYIQKSSDKQQAHPCQHHNHNRLQNSMDQPDSAALFFYFSSPYHAEQSLTFCKITANMVTSDNITLPYRFDHDIIVLSRQIHSFTVSTISFSHNWHLFSCQNASLQQRCQPLEI